MSEEGPKVKRLVERHKKTDAYFKEELDKAIKRQHVQISKEATAYLLWILILGSRMDPHFNADTLVNRYVNAFSGHGPETFRDIGDSSLILAGIWPESLSRGAVGIDYYIEIGRLAYKKEAEASKTLEELFEELSEKFERAAEILTEVIHLNPGKELSPSATVNMYKKWLETHNPVLERKLIDAGLIPMDLKSRKQ